MANGNEGKLITSGRHELPDDLKKDFRKATKLEWLTVAYTLSVVFVMYLSMKGSQAMKAAWLEDVLSMVPAISFLLARSFYNRTPNKDYPYGFHRVFSLAFQTGAFALLIIGLYIFYDSLSGLLKGERPSIVSVVLFGRHWWMGYIMIAALLWSSIPSVFIGQAKLPIAKKLHNKILQVDAKTQHADWQTALAGIIGILALGMGWWWADSASACFISVSIIIDGVKRLKDAVSDLIDQVPTSLDGDKPLPIVDKVHKYMKEQKCVKDVRIRMRESGEIFFVEIFVIPVSEGSLFDHMEEVYKGVKKLDWKVHDVVIVPIRSFSEANNLMLNK